jgi:hypothetical protein
MKIFSSLQKTLTLSMTAIAVLSVGLVGLLWIYQEYSRFSAESLSLKEDYLAGQKAQITQEVDRVVDYIEYQRSTTEDSLKQQIKEQVYSAHAIAENIYNDYKERRTEEEIKSMIRETLRPIRFYNGRGYFFIYDMQGNNILLPFSSQLEGKNLWDLQDNRGEYTIRRMVAVIKDKGEGFLRWCKPDRRPSDPFFRIQSIGTGRQSNDRRTEQGHRRHRTASTAIDSQP